MSDPKTIALQSFRVIETGDAALAEKIIAADFINQEADDDPEDVERQQHGAAGFLATSEWLHNAFANLRFEHHETLAEGNTVIAVSTMTGEHTGVFNGIQPTGTHIQHQQVHIFTITNGQITHHRAIRDDLDLLFQLGWKPGGLG
jgi:predicted ester cyclase